MIGTTGRPLLPRLRGLLRGRGGPSAGPGTVGRHDRQLLLAGPRAHPGLFGMLVVSTLLRALGTLALPAASGRALDDLLRRRTTRPLHWLHGPPTSHGPLLRGAHQVLAPLLRPVQHASWVDLSVALLALLALTSVACAWSGGALAAAAIAHVRGLLVDQSIAVGPALTRSMPTADLVTRLTGNAVQVGMVCVQAAGALGAALPALAATAILFWIDLWCAAVFAIGLVALSVVLLRLMRSVQGINVHYLQAQAAIAATLAEVLGGIRTVAAAGSAPGERLRILAPARLLGESGRALWATQSTAAARAGALLPMLQIVVVAIAGCRLTAGDLTVGQMFAVSGYVALGSTLAQALAAVVALGQARAAAARCAVVLAEPATPYGTREVTSGAGAVTFVDVGLGGEPHPVLRGINVRIPAGQHVALVGRSGSGKSALAALIGRLADPDVGVVCLDGQPVRDLTPEALHRSVTYAFPRPALLGATVADTIGLACLDGDRTAVVQAARDACAAQFIARLPDGYDTPLSQAPMSGGEVQRLGLARAFAHRGRVLVLDDATSSLDTATEHQISAALARGTARTQVVVAHRASTAARADRVLWLEDGRIRGDGTHRELWADAAYRALFAAPGRPGAPPVAHP